jgi:hypothetical protein
MYLLIEAKRKSEIKRQESSIYWISFGFLEEGYDGLGF